MNTIDGHDSLIIDIETLLEACNLYRESGRQDHSNHFDRTGQSGLGCPECIKAKELRNKADALLKQRKLL